MWFWRPLCWWPVQLVRRAPRIFITGPAKPILSASSIRREVGYEEATDLGSITAIENNPASLQDSGYDLTKGAGGAYNFNGDSDLIVAYFASNGNIPNNATEYWTSGAATGTLAIVKMRVLGLVARFGRRPMAC